MDTSLNALLTPRQRLNKLLDDLLKDGWVLDPDRVKNAVSFVKGDKVVFLLSHCYADGDGDCA